MTDESDDYLAGPKIFADGRAGWVEPTNYGARIAIGQLGAPWYDDVWDYSDDKPAGCWRPIAIAALFAWDGTGEPIGWTRHPMSGRRRKDGDPATEYVRP